MARPEFNTQNILVGGLCVLVCAGVWMLIGVGVIELVRWTLS